MAPKTVTNATKLAAVLNYFHTSGAAHSLKDLEKALPSIASINSMQVKDYLQALSDDSKIRVEKIGSGNWYWSFPGEEKRTLEAELEKAIAEKEKTNATVDELTAKVGEATKAKEQESQTGIDQADLMEKQGRLKKELDDLKKELAGYSENDPVELEKKKQDVLVLKSRTEKCTDDIQAMESYLTTHMGVDRESMSAMKQEMYGEEFDEEAGGLKEL